MRKRVLLSFALVLMMALTIFGISSADLPGSGWWFGATFQNVGSSPANVVVTAYDSASSNTYPYTVSPAINPGGNVNVGPADIPSLPSGFEGSIVASSDQPLVAIVNVTNRAGGGFGDPNGKAAALYSGLDGAAAATTLQFPTVKHNFFSKTTTFYIQNAGAASTTVDFDFAMDSGNYSYTSGAIAPGQMVAVDPGLASVPANDIGAMTVTASEPVVGVMLEHQHAASVGTVLQGSEGFTSSDLGQIVYCPTVKVNFFARSSGVQFQNAHSATQDITVYFIASDGTEYPIEFTGVAAGAGDFALNPAGVPNGLYAARVEGSAGPVATIVNESEIPLVNALQTSVTYSCVAAANATSTVAYPSYKEGFFGRTTALQVQNVGGSTATNVVLSFTTDGGSTYTSQPQSINAGASQTVLCVSSNSGFWSGTAMPTSELAGVTVTADQPIIAVSNEASWASTATCSANNGPTSFDKSSANGFNLP